MNEATAGTRRGSRERIRTKCPLHGQGPACGETDHGRHNLEQSVQAAYSLFRARNWNLPAAGSPPWTQGSHLGQLPPSVLPPGSVKGPSTLMCRVKHFRGLSPAACPPRGHSSHPCQGHGFRCPAAPATCPPLGDPGTRARFARLLGGVPRTGRVMGRALNGGGVVGCPPGSQGNQSPRQHCPPRLPAHRCKRKNRRGPALATALAVPCSPRPLPARPQLQAEPSGGLTTVSQACGREPLGTNRVGTLGFTLPRRCSPRHQARGVGARKLFSQMTRGLGCLPHPHPGTPLTKSPSLPALLGTPVSRGFWG